MTISETGGIGSRVLNRKYPVEEGLTAGTTKQTGNRNLTSSRGSLVPRRKKEGIDGYKY